MPLTPREFKDLAPEDRDWEIYGDLQDGLKRFEDLDRRVEAVREDLDVHVADQVAHSGPSPLDHLTGRQKGGVVGAIITVVVTIIVTLDQVGAL